MPNPRRRIPRYQRESQEAAAAQPKLPLGAVPADLTQQVPNNSYSAKPLYYTDVEFTCRDCGKQEVWTAEQQKWWYEVAKGSLYTTAVRCRACRQARREVKPAPVPRTSGSDENPSPPPSQAAH